MPTLITPSPDYLRKFLLPLWQKLDLEGCKPLQIVEGEQDGFPFTIIEMEHRPYGLLADSNSRTVSTFFIVGIPWQPGMRRINQHPAGYQASVDRNYVYLGAYGKRPRPGEWKALIGKTIEVVRALNTAAPGVPSPRVRPAGAGPLVYGFWTVVCGLVALFFSASGIGIMLGLIKSDNASDAFMGVIASLLLTIVALLCGLQNFIKLQRRL